jgi:hypothetical protein
MAGEGGPIFPFSVKPDTAGKVFPNFGGSGSDTEGLGVMASVDADATWKLRFQMPPVLPSATCKLRLWSIANATTGVAKVNPKWVSVAAEEDVDGAAVNAEGTSTVTWGAGDANVIKETKITLDADTPVAAECIAMDLVFETASWTLAQVSTHLAAIIWE